jgi:hypothetical protein
MGDGRWREENGGIKEGERRKEDGTFGHRAWRVARKQQGFADAPAMKGRMPWGQPKNNPGRRLSALRAWHCLPGRGGREDPEGRDEVFYHYMRIAS